MRWGVRARGPLYIYSPGHDHMISHMSITCSLFTTIYLCAKSRFITCMSHYYCSSVLRSSHHVSGGDASELLAAIRLLWLRMTAQRLRISQGEWGYSDIVLLLYSPLLSLVSLIPRFTQLPLLVSISTLHPSKTPPSSSKYNNGTRPSFWLCLI